MSAAISWQDLRILGAIRVRSGITQAPLSDDLQVSGNRVRILRNASHLYVITNAQGFEAFTSNFSSQPSDPPPAVDNNYAITISDPAGRWLPRLVHVTLPRNPSAEPASARQLPDSLFQPINVDLLPTSTATISPWWAVVRVHLQRDVSGNMQAVRGALLRVRAAPDTAPHDGVADSAPAEDAPVLGYALSDARGEALLAIPALPAHTFSNTITDHRAVDDGDDVVDSPVVTFDTPCVIDAIADVAAPWPLDPQTLMTRFNDNSLIHTSLSLSLHAGSRHSITLTLTP